MARRPTRVGRLDGKGASRSRFLGTNAASSGQRRAQRVKSLAANLFDFGQVLGGVGSERFYAHTIPIVAAFPDICEPSGSESDVTLL